MFRGPKNLPLVIALLMVLVAQSALASGHGGDAAELKKGILLVAFGSSLPEAQISFDKIDQSAREKYPNTPIYWAYTSHIIRNIMKENGKVLDSPIQALAKMADEGFTHVAVQSLHTIPGEEYDKMVEVAKRFDNMPDGISHISIGRPLLSTTDDLKNVTTALISTFPKNRGKSAVVLLGHGTHHPADVYYAALQNELNMQTSGAFVGTVEGNPTYKDVLKQLRDGSFNKVYLMPFMSVAGDHARNDMDGDEPDSWKSMLRKEGFKTESILKGTAEFEAITSIWMDHLQDAFKELM